MGRHSGFIASHAALAFADVNFCLIPEVPFQVDALLEALTSAWRPGATRWWWWPRAPGRS